MVNYMKEKSIYAKSTTLRDELRDGMTPFLGGQSFEEAKQEFDEVGYLVFENVIGSREIERARTALKPYFAMQRNGRNDFEGLKSNREYALLGKGDIFAELAIHPLPLGFAEAELGHSCTLSAFLAIQLHPGETVQPWHYDDSHCLVLRPREAWQLSAFWAIDDTTETNGATEIIPSSHKWGEELPAHASTADVFSDNKIRAVEDDPGARPDAIKVCMPAGSLMLAKGTLWHRGGANKSDSSRLILTPQYCPGWVRPLENMVLSIAPETAAKMPQRARELIGYSIHPPFMGYADGVHPQKFLDRMVKQ